jgi:hypothetical protein
LKKQFEESEILHEKQRITAENEMRRSRAADEAQDQVDDLRAKLNQMQKALQQAAVTAESEVVKSRKQAEKLKLERQRLKEEREGQDRRFFFKPPCIPLSLRCIVFCRSRHCLSLSIHNSKNVNFKYLILID